jgi:hypothetical protein
MKFNALATFLVFTSLLTLCSPCLAEKERPIVTIDGLQLIKDSNLALVYAQPGVDLGRYSKIYLNKPNVAFKKNWQHSGKRYDPNTVTTEDMAKIKTELSSLFMKVFSETLEQGGYELVAERAEDVLLVKPSIINLDIVAADIPTANNVRTYSESAGEMTLYMELYDSATDDLLARALDRKEDRHTGYFRWQTRITNKAAATRILQVWANVLKEGLDEARGPSSP